MRYVVGLLSGSGLSARSRRSPDCRDSGRGTERRAGMGHVMTSPRLPEEVADLIRLWPVFAGELPQGSADAAPPKWLQVWLQWTLFVVGRRSSSQFMVPGQEAHGTAV